MTKMRTAAIVLLTLAFAPAVSLADSGKNESGKGRGKEFRKQQEKFEERQEKYVEKRREQAEKLREKEREAWEKAREQREKREEEYWDQVEERQEHAEEWAEEWQEWRAPRNDAPLPFRGEPRVPYPGYPASPSGDGDSYYEDPYYRNHLRYRNPAYGDRGSRDRVYEPRRSPTPRYESPYRPDDGAHAHEHAHPYGNPRPYEDPRPYGARWYDDARPYDARPYGARPDGGRVEGVYTPFGYYEEYDEGPYRSYRPGPEARGRIGPFEFEIWDD